MPTNEERRASAKRKLDQEMELRAQQAKQRRIALIAAAAGVALLAVITTTVLWVNHKSADAPLTADGSSQIVDGDDAAGSATGQLPKFSPSATLGANCQYPASAQPASKTVTPPRSGKVPTDPAEVSVSMLTDHGPIGLMLANGKSPCTVNSFISLANKGFFNDTVCHRLTTSAMLSVLQCGDPAGNGTGGPGYQFVNEYPTDQYPTGDPALHEPVTYPRGTVAMANAGPGTNGSQFFLVYKDSQLPPQYTVFGTIQADGLATLDKIAAAGVKGGGEDGPPATKVLIKSVMSD